MKLNSLQHCTRYNSLQHCTRFTLCTCQMAWPIIIQYPSSFIGAIDDTGGIAVHTCAGTASLIACYIVGPRHHRLSRDGKLRYKSKLFHTML